MTCAGTANLPGGAPATAGPALRARGLERSFLSGGAPVAVLRGVDLDVWAGEVVTLSGPSGSGKSALFALLCGFDTPNAGSVHVLGREFAAARSMSEPRWTDCAVLPQAMGLADELMVAENVALPLRLAGLPGVDARVTELLEHLGIGALADRYPGEVSFGQQQRVSLARAVSARPRLLLADEPTSHLDHSTIPLVVGLLREVADAGSAVLVATHDPVVHAAADRRLRLVHGRIEV